MDMLVEKRHATLRGLVEDKIRDAIAGGMFKPGQRLIERELCETLGVGRTSVREALRQLEAEGLIENTPHKGPSVTQVSPENAAHLYAVRGMLEAFAGASCARQVTPEFADALDAAIDAFVAACDAGSRADMVQTKTAFYALLMDRCGNAYVTKFLTSLHNQISTLRFTSMSNSERLPHSILEIREIAAAIRAGDADRAEAACHIHIENASRAALAQMSE
ncbi:GntR family transcriptional regulator [Sulfitobacter sp. W074]|uniref:GntR family transcriptional regulator n=1 Tax=Sulfitobacter sp. W074 TaxID=2867026 RepID=UPI0021A79CBA|nr:GntR family transcriptional regulator [Sulfitobacter sp. W074]UWR38471.1 GntR family transcriptional regulator [Sulfitobacter sp. W074]